VPIALLWFGTQGCDTKSRTAVLGRQVPEYRAVSLDGDPMSLGALRGRAVLLNVWSVWCPPCRAEIPLLDELYRRYQPAGLEMVGVNVDPRGDGSTVRTFVRASGMTYPVWRDAEDTISARFPATGVPRSYLIGRDGTLVWEHVGVMRRNDPGLRRALEDALGERRAGCHGDWRAACTSRDAHSVLSAQRISDVCSTKSTISPALAGSAYSRPQRFRFRHRVVESIPKRTAASSSVPDSASTRCTWARSTSSSEPGTRALDGAGRPAAGAST
jgi:thiol-disulfide isomerase/thioredoxin